MNLLADQASPDLKQHREHPVHWRPWQRAALDEAQALQKPILFSIGYAACHRCHVMAHESFEDVEIAALMNRLFVNIKVDREERPDTVRFVTGVEPAQPKSFQLIRLAAGPSPTGDDLFRVRIDRTINRRAPEMRVAGGAFGSSLDADSDGEEGRFYTWQQNTVEMSLATVPRAFCPPTG